MTNSLIDYSKCLVYKIVCNDLSLPYCYVGHTTHFTKRKSRHKWRCNNPDKIGYNYKVYQTIRENGGWDNFSMVFIEKFPCENRIEAAARERYWYDQLNADMNKNVPSRTKQEYLKDKKHNKLLSFININACEETQEN